LFIASWRRRRKVTKLELQRMVGKLNWAARVIRGGRTFMRCLIDLLCQVSEKHRHIRLNSAAKSDLTWWENCFDFFHGSCPFSCDKALPSYSFACDACLDGGGAFFCDDWFYVSWEQDYPHMVGRHINELELFTVFLALKRWGARLKDVHVKIRSDNSATVACLQKSTSRSKDLMRWVREIFWLSVEHNILITSAHIPGHLNLLADRISRLSDYSLAMDARLLLANFSLEMITCKDHMSISAFLSLQESWTRVS
jgi:hypothetical protein